ncbi:M15 family metallopeptidase [Hymenobacter sp. BT491]|uniref:M15 family metallopeptidase n=1 Tax=Hymenobacter sp. BT491 TaxID=2766779 RepID=UPI0016537521|nr:M15 family metallopeptidase [Hymenobacter sp. BT491]MBC6990362.1 M15 family metallopeptidase [Hymenobacter sp. BT491]
MLAPNAHGLYVLSSTAHYQQEIDENPDNELVELVAYVPDLVLDIRYATANNVLAEAIYDRPAAYLRRPVAAALREVQEELRKLGIGLQLFDAYRPYSATVRFYEKIGDETYAAPPWRGSRHNRGCSVDVALVELANGRTLPMPTDFDDLTPAAHTTYEPVTEEVRRNRATLLGAMTQHGFVNYSGEWWHFDHQRWADFTLLDLSFAQLAACQSGRLE